MFLYFKLATITQLNYIMTDKEFNVFDEYASRYVQMSPQEEEYNSSS